MTVVNFRTDPETDRALAILTADGTDKSSAIRQAVIVASREARLARLRKESAALAADPDDRAEMQAVMADMESANGPW